MPLGIFYLIHDEIKGPKIKCSYFSSPITLPKEFISKLYMSHAGFESSHLIEIKFDRYKSVSCFTGNLDRRSQKEGILGVIFEDSEPYSNLDLFLMRNINLASNKQDNETIKNLFLNELQRYYELVNILDTVEIKEIPEIFIITGTNEYKSCPLKIGERNVSNSEMVEIYKKIVENQMIPHHFYFKLNIIQFKNAYLVFKTDRTIENFNEIISTIKIYLENSFFYSLEILILFLFPSIVRILPHTPQLTKKYVDKNQSILQYLQKSEDYANEFNNLVSYLIEGDIYISPLSTI
ncbi:MAG: hypothetical protein JSV62_03450 [Promethearchaeota archaeon]|nr:MAG: hypothetical protein JSV62_03450 [Candidatus Lokiarchaeota archaeon]